MLICLASVRMRGVSADNKQSPCPKSAGVRAADVAGGGRTVASGPQFLSPAEVILTSEKRGLDYTHGTHLWWVRDQKRSRGRCPDFGSSSRFCGTTDDFAISLCPASPDERPLPARTIPSRRGHAAPSHGSAPVGVERAGDFSANSGGATASGAESGASELQIAELAGGDGDLRRLIEVWPTLPESVRRH